MRFGWRQQAGLHYVRGKRYAYPTIIETHVNLEKAYPQKFYRIDIPNAMLRRPLRLGSTDFLERKQDGMNIFIKSRQHFVPVPQAVREAGATSQELVVLEDEVEILRAAVPFNEDGTEPDAETLPTWWGKVGSTIILELTYKSDDGRLSDAYETSFVQVDPWPDPVPEPEPTPEPDPTPEPEPEPEPVIVTIPAPEALGVTESTEKVSSEGRPVQVNHTRR